MKAQETVFTEWVHHFARAVMLCATWALSGGAADAQIVINEIEYDQGGPDEREFIELYEPAKTGMGLAGWQLVLYNGTASQRSPYRTIELGDAPGGVMPGDGYLVIGTSPGVANVDISLPANWIQNGAPDGMALVRDNGNTVVELLAYEGSFVGNTNSNGGPAAGMTFPDIGVAEDSGDCIGLQKDSDGAAWSTIPESVATPGAACGVDVADYLPFLNCLGGPAMPLPDGCDTEDWDCDGAVDIHDFAVFQIALTDPPCP